MIMISKTEACNMLRISTNKFNLLVLEPVKTYQNKYKKNVYLYDKDTILQLSYSDVVTSLRGKERIKKNYLQIFEKKYKNHKDLLPICCDNMFNLNRYAKNYKCIDKNKTEIYKIKNEFIRYLYQDGYCTNVQKHKDVKKVYYSFDFSVKGVSYSWHQPLDRMSFKPILSPDCQVIPMPKIETNKDIYLKTNKFKESKELIKWFLNKEKMCCNEKIPT